MNKVANEASDHFPLDYPKMPQEDWETKGFITQNNEDKVKHELILKLWLGLLKFYESILNKRCFVLPFPLFTEMHEVNIESRVFLVEVRVIFFGG